MNRCKKCIDSRKSFVLQGGAGSGKTESLKELLLYIKTEHPKARVICITHTNAAVDEIVGRVGEQYLISTIHSFLYGLIGHYKKNIKSVISELFFVPEMVRAEQLKEQKEADYKKWSMRNIKEHMKNMRLIFIEFAKRILKRLQGKESMIRSRRDIMSFLIKKFGC